VRLPNAWVHHLINLESHFEAFTAINRLVATLSPAGQAAAQTLRMWSRASCVAYTNANNLQSTGIVSALWTDITPDRPLMQYAHGLHQDLRRALPCPPPPIPQHVQQSMTPADITQIIADTNRRNAPASFSLSPLHTNQLRGYCGRTDPAHDSEELSEFYEGLAFVSKTDADIRLYIDAFVSGEYWHRHIVGAPELVITKNILDVIKNVSPQRSVRAYSECHLGLTPMAVPIMSREAAAAMLEEQDN
jgi:hypothetical protein